MQGTRKDAPRLGRHEGRAEEAARNLLTVLGVRRIAVPDTARERILANLTSRCRECGPSMRPRDDSLALRPRTPDPWCQAAKTVAKRLDQILVVDLESTCWEGPPPPGQVSEIIEVGVCTVDVASLERVEKRSILIKPVQVRWRRRVVWSTW